MRLTRNEAIHDIREMLLTLVDEENSVCQVASKLGICCHGFSQLSFSALKRRFPWIAEGHPEVDRAEFERLANDWLLTLQFVCFGRLPCDTFARSSLHTPCKGWEEFYEGELASFYHELFGVEVQVVPEALKPTD